MTIRAPAYELTIGSRRWTEQVLDIDVRLHAAPIPDVVTARFPVNADLGASAGDRVVLRLDGGDGAREVFTGELDALAGHLDGTTVVAIDAGGILARYRPAVTLEQATAATVIRALCDDAGVSAGTVDDGVRFAYYAAEPTRTAWEHVARVSGWGGAVAMVDADGRVTTVVPGGGPAEIALRHGRDVIALERIAARRRVEAWVVAGEAGVGSADDPDALRPTTDFFGGSRPDGPGTDSAWTFAPALRTAGAARTFADARLARGDAANHRWRLESLLRPELRVGALVAIDDLPDRLPGGTFVVGSVHHVLAPWSVRTLARLTEAGAGGPEGLLGLPGGAARSLS
jgi:hypothetical protein